MFNDINHEDGIMYMNESPNKKHFIHLEKNNLSPDEKQKIIGISKADSYIKPHWYLVDNKWYYFKGISKIETLINELLGVQLAKEISLDTVEYKLADLDEGKYKITGIISESWINPDKKYLKATELGHKIDCDNSHNLELLKKVTKNKDNYEQLLTQLYKMTLLDFYMSQIDRVGDNIGFVKDVNGLYLNKIFDYSACFNTLVESEIYPYFPNTASYYYFHNKNTLFNRDSSIYTTGNYLFSLNFPSEEVINIYGYNEDLYKSLEKLYNFDLLREIETIENNLGGNVPKTLKLHYKNEVNKKREQLETILDNIKR